MSRDRDYGLPQEGQGFNREELRGSRSPLKQDPGPWSGKPVREVGRPSLMVTQSVCERGRRIWADQPIQAFILPLGPGGLVLAAQGSPASSRVEAVEPRFSLVRKGPPSFKESRQ